MPTSPIEALVIAGGTVSTALAILGVRTWLHHRRRLRFRAAAIRAGLELRESQWVVAKIGATLLSAEELYHTPARSNPIKETRMTAELPGEFPEAFHASTDEGAIGLLRSTFPTASGKHRVYVRGLDEVAVTRFVDDTVRRALEEGLELCPEAEVVPGYLRVARLRWFDEEHLVRMFRGFTRLARTLAPTTAGYRDS